MPPSRVYTEAYPLSTVGALSPPTRRSTRLIHPPGRLCRRTTARRGLLFGFFSLAASGGTPVSKQWQNEYPGKGASFPGLIQPQLFRAPVHLMHRPVHPLRSIAGVHCPRQSARPEGHGPRSPEVISGELLSYAFPPNGISLDFVVFPVSGRNFLLLRTYRAACGLVLLVCSRGLPTVAKQTQSAAWPRRTRSGFPGTQKPRGLRLGLY